MPLLKKLLILQRVHVLCLFQAEALLEAAPVHHVQQSLIAKQIELQAVLLLLLCYLVLLQLLGVDLAEVLLPVRSKLLSIEQFTVLYSCLLVIYGRVSLLQELLVDLADLPLEAFFRMVSPEQLLERIADEVFFDGAIMVLERRQAYSREVQSSHAERLRTVAAAHVYLTLIISTESISSEWSCNSLSLWL